MISRFSARRLLCCLMAALTFFGALSPALFQPADAVAVADDVLIASLGLLAMSWAGISFSSCAGAQTAVNSFLSSKPAAKLSLAGLMTKELVVDGSKLLLTSDVRDVFKSVLPDIRDFFKSDTLTDNGSGTLSGSLVVGASYSLIKISPDIYNNMSSSDFNAYLRPYCTLPAIPGIKYEILSSSSDGLRRSSVFEIFPGSDLKYMEIYNSSGTQYLGHIPMNSTFCLYVVPGTNIDDIKYFSVAYIDSSGQVQCYYTRGGIFPYAPTYRVISASDSISFNQSKEVDGSSALEILAPAPLNVVNPGGSSGGDGSQKPEIDFSKYGMFALEGLIGALLLTGDQAKKDPGLDPEQMVDQLKKAMESTQTEPKPDPDPQPDPDPDTPGGSSGTAPDFNGMMLPGLKDFFPFCIPFDLKKMMDALCADPVAPKFTFATSFLGQIYTVDIDLSAWDGVATTVRYMVVATYIVCLAVATRKFIKW